MKQNLEFKYFLLNEDTTYLAGRIGDILNAIQDIQQNAQGMGTKQLVCNAERVVNQIRRIIHTNWGSDNRESLEILQRVGVAIERAIEEKGDIIEILTNSSSEIQDKLADMGVPINSLGVKDKAEKEKSDQTAPPQGKEQEKEQGNNQLKQTPKMSEMPNNVGASNVGLQL